MKPQHLKKYLYTLPALCFLAVIFGLSFLNRNVAATLAQQASPSGFPAFTNSMEQHLADNLVGKYDFIELNGAMNRLLGVNTLNGTERLANGSLSTPTYPTDNTLLADKLQQLSSFLEEDGVGFLCVGVPRKEYFYDVQTMPGYEDHHDLARDFIPLLRQRNIPHLDMDTWFQENGWTMEDTFFKTDHHWRPEAAFAAVGQIMTHFAANSDIVYDSESLNLDNWNVEVYEDWFLGSEGKHTGASYAGTDDISFLSPKFPTDIRVGRIMASGEMDVENEHTLYHTRHIERKNYHLANPHDLYLGGNYPFTYIRNNLAVNDQRLIVIGDSYRLPAECFLATQFTEIFHIDMRYYSAGTFAEFARQIDADQVLLLFCGPLDSPIHSYGIDAWNETFAGKSPAEPLVERKEIALTQTTSRTDCRVIAADLPAGAYELTLTGAELRRDTSVSEESPGLFVQAALMDTHSRSIAATRYFLANDDSPQRWLFTVPQDPNASYAVVLYNGVNLYTSGNSTVVRDITLTPYS